MPPLDFQQDVISCRETAPSKILELAEKDLQMYMSHCVS